MEKNTKLNAGALKHGNYMDVHWGLAQKLLKLSNPWQWYQHNANSRRKMQRRQKKTEV